MIKAHFSGRKVSSGMSDVAFASIYSEKTLSDAVYDDENNNYYYYYE